MTILNAPIRDACVSRRERTNTPSQALLLLNESEYMKAARNLAMKILVPKEATVSQRIAFAYETITSRLPDKQEQETLYELLQSLYQTYSDVPVLADALCDGLTVKSKEQKTKIAAWTLLVNSLYNLDITKTRD